MWPKKIDGQFVIATDKVFAVANTRLGAIWFILEGYWLLWRHGHIKD
jgi:uncharacterized membrane protein YccF (DUF307 family)